MLYIDFNVFNMKIYWLLTIKATKAKSIKHTLGITFYTKALHFSLSDMVKFKCSPNNFKIII